LMLVHDHDETLMYTMYHDLVVLLASCTRSRYDHVYTIPVVLYTILYYQDPCPLGHDPHVRT